ncbi:alpha-L-fucosidase [Pontiella sulfatireligans]|nr:alpha-L-fucosidase [Pontiella sulfatireligans]
MNNRIFVLGIALMVSACVTNAAFEANWESLSKQPIPEWMKDAKFGVYTHWSVFSVPAFGGPDYIKNVYGGAKKDAKGAYSHHLETYGSLDKNGYINFVDQFTAPKFNADEWVDLMYEAGARFGGILLVHHDGFCLWDSEHTRWNSMDKGPKRDVYGEIATAVRKHDDMKLLATFHHGRTLGYATGFMDKEKGIPVKTEENKDWDIWNPEYQDFYWNEGAGAKPEVFAAEWEAKIKEVVDKYSPDCIWFDGLNTSIRNNAPSEQQVMDTFAYYFNEAEKKGQEVTICNKHAGQFNFPDSFGFLCYENGREMALDVKPWYLIDRAIAYPWSYVTDKKYKDGPDYHIKSLIDLVSRGGVFLLSLTPKGDGSIPDEEIAIMKGMGRWMKVNAEAIHATRPWKISGEGPAVMLEYNAVKKRDDWNYRQPFIAQDIRFTVSKDGKTLYATALNWPENGKIVVKSLAEGSEYYPGKIGSVEMVGLNEPVKWIRTAEGLEITFPKDKPADWEWAYAFRIR